jgi:glucose/arabinose dehydrogenase
MTENTPKSETTGLLASRRRFLGAAAAGAVVGASGCMSVSGQSTTASSGGPVPQGPTIGLETVDDSVEEPTDFAVPPGSNRRFVLERAGQVRVIGSDGGPFLDVSGRMTPVEGEQGLLGIAFHPNFQQNGRFYLRYSAPPTDGTPESYSHTAVLSEFRANGDRTSGRLGTERRLLEVPEPQSNHNAGAVTFGPDGYLYVPFGDGGGANDVGTGHASDWYEANEGGNGQDVTENFLGSMLRIDVDGREGGKPYAIPDDNPLVGRTGLDEQFAWGFRNPWRMGFSNGRLFVADVGQNRYEEVDIVRKGGNYGWNVREGTHCFSTSGTISSCPDSTPPDVRGGEPLISPIIEYPHTRNGQPIGISVIGGYVYDGRVDALGGQYVFGDYSQEGGPQGSLFAATPGGEGQWSFEKLQIAGAANGELNAYLLDVGRDNAGELYALTTGGELGGGVHKIVSQSNASGTNNATAGTTRVRGGGNGTRAGGGAADEANGTGNGTNTANGTSSTNGPGFGALAALAGLAGVGARLLGRE